MATETKDSEFAKLIEEVHACRKCARMANSAHVLNFSSGDLNADLFFIGEAPGRLGADQTKVPFHGDRSGRNFEELLSFAEIKRKNIFVTNAVLCNPRDKKGNNSTPNRAEADNCQPFLKRQIELVNPKIVISLGVTALRALKGIESHDFVLRRHVRSIHSWFGRSLIPLYHPGQRAMIHRTLAMQQLDFKFVAEQAQRLQTNRYH